MTAPASPPVAPPSWTSMTLNRYVVELKEFLRSREQMVFIFAFPMMLLVLFGSVFGGAVLDGTDVTFAQYFLAGMVASGILNTGFQSLAMSIAIDRDEDVLKRIHATPLPATSYFAAKILQVLSVTVVQVVILIAIGVALYDVALPSDAAHWGTFAWVFLLGTAGSTTLGIAMSSLLRNAKAGSAIITPIVLFLQFTSGVFLIFTQVPAFLQTVASIFPLRWLAQGMRSVFLPDEFKYAEAAGSWQLPLTALILAVWVVVGLVLAVRTFRWTRHDDN
ncbi:ABC transporter permease [Demequina lignilytica]|uniref:Transport permease protein n=1 Tax=Demequina lignilytica TaxID=3051663 RepID=A0AAW7M9Z4_9MICO|nr:MULTISPECIES: ABC transporter permease [unclassified Demequina]MDN4478084.1 ABC transporter permease [Demequina sp. SYSU T00039-1]MDN4482836.1 ABC transporter permease [Demequina sp. SYSU T0a273]MDN4488466.1 ABC transporter permease [Demequina sp. SYSU T00039]MDN4489987.1 ABC transporter permease [Demequina sp. SYSU T00068]